MSLSYLNYFKQKQSRLKKKKTNFESPLNCLKNVDTGPAMGRELLPEILLEQSVFEVGDRWAPDWTFTKSQPPLCIS